MSECVGVLVSATSPAQSVGTIQDGKHRPAYISSRLYKS